MSMLEKSSTLIVYRKLLGEQVTHKEVSEIIAKYNKMGITEITELPCLMYTFYGEKYQKNGTFIDLEGNIYNSVFGMLLPINFPGLKYFSDDVRNNGTIILDDVAVSKLCNILDVVFDNTFFPTEYYNKDILEKYIKDLQLLTGNKEYIPLNLPYNTLRNRKIDPRDISSFAKYKNDTIIEDSLNGLYQIAKDYFDLDLLPNEDRVLVYTEYNK